jgi:hypothetical protein
MYAPRIEGAVSTARKSGDTHHIGVTLLDVADFLLMVFHIGEANVARYSHTANTDHAAKMRKHPLKTAG